MAGKRTQQIKVLFLREEVAAIDACVEEVGSRRGTWVRGVVKKELKRVERLRERADRSR